MHELANTHKHKPGTSAGTSLASKHHSQMLEGQHHSENLNRQELTLDHTSSEMMYSGHMHHAEKYRQVPSTVVRTMEPQIFE